MQKPNLNPPIRGVCTTSGGATSDKPVFVIKSYRNGNSWYRKYSDGTIEQGGYTDTLPAATDTSTTINFIEQYTTDNIQIFLTPVFSSKPTTGNNGGMMACNLVNNLSTQQYYAFDIYWDTRLNNLEGCYWLAVGK